MNYLLLSISLLLASSAVQAETAAGTTQQVAKHKNIDELVKEGKIGVMAALAAYEAEAKNIHNPHHTVIKEDVEVLKKIAKSTQTADAIKHAQTLSKATKDAIAALYKDKNKWAQIKAAQEWFNNKKA